MRDLLDKLNAPVLKEGGNVFKDANKQPVTTRIPKDKIAPSLAFVEKILGFKLDQWLGTTGKKDTSGDIDVSVDANQHDKKEIATRLKQWAKDNGYKPGEWVKLSGDNVHFKLPIAGTNEFAQLDLMFGNPVFQQWSMRGEPGEWKGVHRHIISASIAKAQGLKWSYKGGLTDRNDPNKGTQDPQEIVQTLTPGYSGDPMDWHIDDIFRWAEQKYGNNPETLQQLFGEADATLQAYHSKSIPLLHQDQDVNENAIDDINFLAKLRDRIVNQGMQMIIEGVRIEHPEDLPIEMGSQGLKQAINSLSNIAKSSDHITIKWDGIPAIIFGRKPSGEFVLTDKSGFLAKGYDGKATSPEMLAQIMNNRKGGGREELIKIYQTLWPLLEASVPPGFNGYIMGDLLYASRPDISNGSYIFTPNTVTYEVDATSDIGKAIGKSEAAVAIHTYVDQEGGKTPLKHAPEVLQHSPGVLFLDPYFDESPKLNISPEDKKKLQGISALAADVDSFINPAEFKRLKMSNLPALIKKYINAKVTAGSFDNLGNDFIEWLQTSKESAPKIQRITDYIMANKKGFWAVLDAFINLGEVKTNIINQLDQQTGSVRAHINGAHGHEGYVADTEHGPIKFVDRMRFSQANFNKQR